MWKLIAPWWCRKPRGVGAPAPRPRTPALSLRPQAHETARALATGLDRAMKLGLWQQADQIAVSAQRLAAQHPMLCEGIARLRVAQNQPEQALAIIDSCPMHTSSLRFWRDVCLLHLGQRDEAHLDLRQWATKSSAPLAARTLLALLEWQAGDFQAAHAALLQNLKQIEDPQSIAVLMMLNAAVNRRDVAEHWAARLQAVKHRNPGAVRHLPDADFMGRSIGLATRADVHAEPDDEQIAALSLELLAAEEVLPALVEAQSIQPQPATLRLLGLAIERSLSDLHDRATGYLALARIKMLQNEAAAALEWARRGMAECPMSIDLARAIREWSPPHSFSGPLAQEQAA